MPSSQPNQFARTVAVVALAAAFILVIIVFATSSGGGGGREGGDDEQAQEGSKITREGREALARGEYVVEPGDTLVKIAEVTGTDVEELATLNPDLDPQALISDQKVKLPQGETAP
jgi:hypothetical protein